MNKFNLVIFTILSLLMTTPIHANNSQKQINSHFAQVNGIELHYREAGSGPLIILLHGWPETSYAWINTMNFLSDKYRVVAPDLRGLGQSERTQNGYDKKTIATDIQKLIEHLGEKQAIIVGHDMGGKAAYMMAHLYPESVSKLVLVDCLIPGTENGDALHGGAWHYGFHMAPDFPEMLTKGREEEYIRAQIKTWSFKKDAIDDETIHEYAGHYAAEGGMTAGFNYYRALKEDAALAQSFDKQKLLMPVLTISGRYGVAEKLPQALKDSTTSLDILVIEESGHFVVHEAPEKFNIELIRFVEK